MSKLSIKKALLCVLALVFLVYLSTAAKYPEYMSDISVQYNALSLDDKLVYKQICKNVDTATEFDLQRSEMLSDSDYRRLLSILVNEDYRYFYVRDLQVRITDDIISVVYTKDISENEIQAHLNAYNSIINAVASETADLTDRAAFERFYKEVQKAEQVYDGGNSTNAVGCLVEKQANCQGYAKALRQLCLTHKIPCILLCGTFEGVNHMWNMVYIDNKWYYSDPANFDGTPLFDVLSESYIVF